MIKELLCRFQECAGPFGMLAVERCSETVLFRHLPHHLDILPHLTHS